MVLPNQEHSASNVAKARATKQGQLFSLLYQLQLEVEAKHTTIQCSNRLAAKRTTNHSIEHFLCRRLRVDVLHTHHYENQDQSLGVDLGWSAVVQGRVMLCTILRFQSHHSSCDGRKLDHDQNCTWNQTQAGGEVVRCIHLCVRDHLQARRHHPDTRSRSNTHDR